MDKDKLPHDHDGVKDRMNDILFSDRNSLYDENNSNLISDYNNFASQMKNLFDDALNKFGDKDIKEDFEKKLKDILATKTTSKNRNEEPRKYKDLLKTGLKLTKVIRIERTNYTDSIYSKIGDLSIETINKLIKEGEWDAWFSLITEYVKDMELVDADESVSTTKDKLIAMLNETKRCLRNQDYGDSNSEVYHHLREFICMVKDKSNMIGEHSSSKLIKLAEELRDRL
jgi:NTE family protein